MIIDNTDTLTYEKLMAAVADVMALQRPIRIIAEFPLIPPDSAGMFKAENVLVIGRDAWREVLETCLRVTGDWKETIYGVPVEMFDLAREDHRVLIRSLLPTTVMQYDPRRDLEPWHKSYIPRPFPTSSNTGV